MNPLVKKEIRLLLPRWLTVLFLGILLPWLCKYDGSIIEFSPVVLFFCTILITLDSFGSEFSLGTYSSLMSQPIERQKIWRTKITILAVGVASFFIAHLVSYELWFRLRLPVSGSNHWIGLGDDWWMWVGVTATLILIAMAGGFWTSLLLRQVAAAFWITFLAPAGLLMAIFFFLPAKLASNDHVMIPLLCGVAAIYIVAGFWFAHRLFHRAQDAAWTGGVIAFSKWRYFESGFKSSVSLRKRRPLVALAKKELQLQSISWFCATALTALHLAVIVMRKVHGIFERDSLAGTASEFFWTFWLIMPLIIGCIMVAEERRLGVTEGQFCLPASRRLQFALKFFSAIFFGVLVGGFMPLLLESFAAYLGAPNPDFNPLSQEREYVPAIIIFLALPLGLSLAGFFASTLVKNFLQALGAAVVIIVGCILFTALTVHLQSFLTISVTIFTTLAVVPWLAYGNFNHFQERGRIWRRNIFGLFGAILFIFIFSAALYNRAWEFFEPAEPAHGSAKLSLANPPSLQSSYYGSLRVQLPDGRVWFDNVNYQDLNGLKKLWQAYVSPFPVSTGPQKFMSGSNWVSATGQYINTWVPSTKESQQYDKHVVGYTESVGIQPDGTLWVSGKSDPKVWTADKLTRFGDETNWQQAAQSLGLSSVLLLKKDGTLWRLGTNYFEWRDWPQKWPGLRTFTPYQIGTNSDWNEIGSDGWFLAQKKNGTVWRIERNKINFQEQFVSETNFNQVSLQTFAEAYASEMRSYVRKDGTLWVLDHRHDRDHGDYFKVDQITQETNWVSVAITWDRMIALKSDGTLWQWEHTWSEPSPFGSPPRRLGIHNDWIAVASSQGGLISLAADGSLWFWPASQNYYYQETLLKLPKQPRLLGNVFGNSTDAL